MKFLKRFFTFGKDKIEPQDLSSLAFSQSPMATAVTDEKGTIANINSSFTELTGYTELDIIGENMSILKSGKHDNAFYKMFYKKINELDKYTLELENRCKDGTVLLFKASISKIQSSQTQYYIVVFEDITEQNKLSQRHQYLATHDPLTGLANRMLLNDRFNHAVYNATRSRKKLAVLMCDLNEFKQINDTYGHHVGDMTLQKVAKKLKNLVREGDTIARCGGDEFIVILEQLESVDEIEKVVNVLKFEFPLILDLDNESYEIGMSIGYSHFPQEGTTLEQLTSQADRKMYKDKDRYYGT